MVADTVPVDYAVFLKLGQDFIPPARLALFVPKQLNVLVQLLASLTDTSDLLERMSPMHLAGRVDNQPNVIGGKGDFNDMKRRKWHWRLRLAFVRWLYQDISGFTGVPNILRDSVNNDKRGNS